MKRFKVYIDGGTTNTRFTLMNRDEVIAREEYKIGASDALHPHKNGELKDMVERVICDMEKKYECQIHIIYASGMITSNIGICEIPYVNAPAGVNDMVRSIEMRQIDVSGELKTICFVPGISFKAPNGRVTDVMRGEEVEVFGGLGGEEQLFDIMFIHFGSHNKMIYCKRGMICDSTTTISGELAWAILNKTIIKSSSCHVDDEAQLDENFICLGYETALKHGLSRALFMARLLQTQEHVNEYQITSYIYGVLVQGDITAFSELLKARSVDKFILYGRDCFIRAFLVCIKLYDSSLIEKMITLTHKESEKLSIYGMNLISKQHHIKQERGEELEERVAT